MAVAVPPAFGWGSATGDILDDSVPYSLGLLANKFPASELLLGSYVDGKQLSGSAYKLTTPVAFPFSYEAMAGQTSMVLTVLGTCMEANGPSMLRWIGFTTLGDRYRLRDKKENDGGDVFGLYPDGFSLGGDNCSNAGKLDGSQGLIFRPLKRRDRVSRTACTDL